MTTRIIPLFLLLACAPLPAADWPQWRGAQRDDISTETGLMKSWPRGGPKKVWTFDDAGLGYAGFAVVGDTLYTMGARDAVEYVVAVDTATGKERWSAEVGALYTNDWGDGPRCTPTVDGDLLYAIGGRGDLVCLNRGDGSQVWTVSLVSDLGGKLQSWGYTESPLIEGGLVICTPGGQQGTMAAFDKMSGEKKWQTSDWTDVAQYSSPIAVTHNGGRQVIQLTMNTLAAVNPADGAVLWRTEFPGKVAVIPTPIFKDSQVFVAAGYKVGCMAVRIGAGNSVERLYENTDMVNHHGGVILVGDHLYGFSDGAGWTCMDFKTGKVVWTEKRALGKGAIHCADGMLYLQEEDSGTVCLVEASPRGWKEAGRFQLSPQTEQRKPKGKVWVHPVVAHGKLYLRDQELIHCHDVKR
jgi:outer membrane protein assembly factor BamB